MRTRPGCRPLRRLRALADNDPQQTNPSRNWQVAAPEDLFADARMRAALTHFAHEKAATLGSQVTLKPPLKAVSYYLNSFAWPGLDFDLTDGYQDEFDRLKK